MWHKIQTLQIKYRKKTHHNKFTLNKERKKKKNITNDHSKLSLEFFDTKWENDNTFSKIKEKKKKK